MSDHDPLDLHDLLSDAVDDFEPGYALDEIRARTKSAPRTWSRWPYAAGAGILAIAASLTAFAVLGNDAPPRVIDPGTNTSQSPSPSPSLSPNPSSEPPTPSPSYVPSPSVAVYYVGNTPDGPRLYREFHASDFFDPLEAAVWALQNQTPSDLDYRTYWPAGAIAGTSFDGVGDEGIIGVNLTDTSLHDRPAGMDEAEAQMAIEQLIYTLQGAVGGRSAVSFSLDGNPIDQVFGVPTSEPLSNGPVLDTLALVSLTTPSVGTLVDPGEPLLVEGVGNSFEGNIVTRITRPDGTEVVAPEAAIAGMGGDKLFPFEVTFDISGLGPGQYVVTSQTDDPSGQGLFHSDTRTIEVLAPKVLGH